MPTDLASANRAEHERQPEPVFSAIGCTQWLGNDLVGMLSNLHVKHRFYFLFDLPANVFNDVMD